MINLKTDNGIATVTITHGKANAFDIELSDELAECFEQISESAARAVVSLARAGYFRPASISSA
jgi:enoyl-CoA hydratase/carnithine racemase